MVAKRLYHHKVFVVFGRVKLIHVLVMIVLAIVTHPWWHVGGVRGGHSDHVRRIGGSMVESIASSIRGPRSIKMMMLVLEVTKVWILVEWQVKFVVVVIVVDGKIFMAEKFGLFVCIIMEGMKWFGL